MEIAEMIKGAYPEIYMRYEMYTIGKKDTVCIEEFLILGGLFSGVNWGKVTPEEMEMKFNIVEQSLK